MTFSLVEGSTIYFIEGSGGKIKEAAESRKVEFGIAFHLTYGPPLLYHLEFEIVYTLDLFVLRH